MSFSRSKSSREWHTEKWTGDRRFPDGYVVTNILDESGAAEIVAWAPQRDRAEQIARVLRTEIDGVRGGTPNPA